MTVTAYSPDARSCGESHQPGTEIGLDRSVNLRDRSKRAGDIHAQQEILLELPQETAESAAQMRRRTPVTPPIGPSPRRSARRTDRGAVARHVR